MPRSLAAIRWLTPRSCRSRESRAENSELEAIVSLLPGRREGGSYGWPGPSPGGKYAPYSLAEMLRIVKGKSAPLPAILSLTKPGKGVKISQNGFISAGGAASGPSQGVEQDRVPVHQPPQRAAGLVRGGGAGRGTIPWEPPPQRPLRASRRGRVMPAIASLSGHPGNGRQREWYRRVRRALCLLRKRQSAFFDPYFME